VDSRGQWGAPRRFDNIPYMGVRQLLYAVDIAAGLQGKTLPRPETLTAANWNASVRHGNAMVTLPLQLLFQSQDEANKRFAEGRAVDLFKERQEFTACTSRAQAAAAQEAQKAEACARDLLKTNPQMRTDEIYAGVAACMQAP